MTSEQPSMSTPSSLHGWKQCAAPLGQYIGSRVRTCNRSSSTSLLNVSRNVHDGLRRSVMSWMTSPRIPTSCSV